MSLTKNSTRLFGPRRSRLLTPRFLIALLAIASMAASLLGPLGSATVRAEEGTRFTTMSKASSPYGVVASASEQASRVGIDVLNRGGNAVDAAVATIFAHGVTRPDTCGLGAGGFLVYRSRTGEVAVLDFREFAPAGVTPTTFQGEGMHKNPLGGVGHLPIGVPGTVAGMAEAHRKLGSGRFSLAQLISGEAGNRTTPYAYELARDGIDVTFELGLFATLFLNTRPFFPETMRIYGGIDALYFSKEKLVQEDYANSLKLIMEFGPEAFYQVKDYPPSPPSGLLPRKSIAKLIVEDMQTTGLAYGALMTAEDLSSYEAKWREPLVGTYRGYEIIAAPPPTSGGIATIEILNLLEGFPVGSNSLDPADKNNTKTSWAQSSANHLHHLAEAQKIAWADRDYFVGDPKFVTVPQAQLISKGYADGRRQEIERDTAKKDYAHYSGPGAPTWPQGASASGMHTTHVSVLDRFGNAVSITHTINTPFGSAVVAPGTGFLLNNQLTDFNMDAPDSANAPGPRKRPRSSNSPTIVVKDGRAVLVTGGAGGSYTPLAVVQNIVNMIDFQLTVAQAIDAERIDARAHGGKDCPEVCVGNGCSRPLDCPDDLKEWTLRIDDLRVETAVKDELKVRGHTLSGGTFKSRNTEYSGNAFIEAVAFNPVSKLNEAASDPNHNRNFDGLDEERGALEQLNFALTSNGATASASSLHSSGNYPALAAINGERTGNSWGASTGGWNDGTRDIFPDTLDVDFGASKSITAINVFTLQNNWINAGEPTLETSASGEGILDFEVQMWNGTDFVPIPGCSCGVTNNDKAWRQFVFPPITTNKIRVKVTAARNNWSRIVEVEAFGYPTQ